MLWKTKAGGTFFKYSAILLIISGSIPVLVLGEKINGEGCGRSKPLGRIVNGQKATKKEIPWIVSLSIEYKYNATIDIVFGCGGSIISPSFILTAAHCLYTNYTHERPSKVLAHYNSSKRRSGVQRLVEKAVPHANYVYSDPYTDKYDIAILKLHRRLVFDDFVKPICLPMRKFDIDGKRILVAGWGDTETGEASAVLLRATLKGLSYKKCITEFNPLMEDALMICTVRDSGQTCHGDSGGPMTIRKKNGISLLLGIVHGGFTCNRTNTLNLGVRVSAYIPWIKQQMKRLKRSRQKSTTTQQPVEKSTTEEPIGKTTAGEPFEKTTGEEPVENVTTELPVEETTEPLIDEATDE